MAKEKVSAQGLLDTLFLDKSTVNKIKQIIAAVDPNKIRAVMDCLEKDDEGWLHVKIDLAVRPQ